MADLNESKTIRAVPNPTPETGIDTQHSFVDNFIDAAAVGALDISSIDALSQSAQNRESKYQLLDQMATDDVVSAILEVYAEDTVQTNDRGQIVWIDSADTQVLEYTTWLLDSLNIDKCIYQWAYCLVTYGDVYVRLYRKSDYGDDLLFKDQKKKQEQLNEASERNARKKAVNEDVKLRLYANNDPYIPYVEMVPNPGEMFDLQKFGKTHGYIKAPIRMVQQTSDELYNYLTRYKMKQRDVEVYDAMSFVHGCLENTTQRQPETVDIYLENYVKDSQEEYEDSSAEYSGPSTSYSVKRGQSILYNSFRIWRELNLMEMSALLNRITQSSVVRAIGIEVGDMPKEQTRAYMERFKEKIEQKMALSKDNSMQEYTNPGPIINTIYYPTHGGQGGITTTNIGGDFDPKALTDIEYFRDKLFGSLKVPKQFFGFTEDGAGFNGGQSLTVISARYGKTIKKIQNVIAQLVTDIINLFLIDRGLDQYVNKFTVRMQAPVTQEELDRRQNTDNRTRYIGDIMNQLNLIEDNAVKLKIYKILLTQVVNDSEVISIIQDYIDKLEAQMKETGSTENNPSGGDEGMDFSAGSSGGGLDLGALDMGAEGEGGLEPEPTSTDNAESDLPSPAEVLPNESFAGDRKKDLILEQDGGQDSYMPSPNELGVDFTKSQN